MKSKFSYKSKRTIIIAAVITVLLAGTATGVYFFTKGNAQAQAAGDGNTTMQEEQHGEAPIENQSGEQTTTPSNNEQEETNQNQTGEQQTTEEQQENQEQTTNTQATQNNQTTTTATTGEVPNQEYVTEREETIINPWETLTVGWGPTQFASIASTANLTAKKSNLEIHKTVDKKSVKIGDTLTYTISVKNNGDKVAKAIIYDNVPEGTVLLNKDNNEDENTKKLTWRVTVEPGETENVEFTVRVKAEKGTIKNSAIVNGKTTNETKTGVVNIKTTKISTPLATPLHEMDQITYTLTAKNSGDGEGIVKISDIVPQGTTLVENSIKLENKIYTEAELNEGIDVTLGGKEEKSITFTVTINPFKEEKIIIRNAEAKQDGENIPGTEDEVEKEYVSININKEFVDKENIDKYRPTEILFGLYANENSNAIITTTTLNEQNNWKGSFTGLDKYDLETKALINYDVREIEVDKNYTPTYDSERKGNNITFNFTNILKYENVITSVTANKIWNDNEGKVGARTSVTFELYKDGEATGITQTASDSLKWKVTFQNLQKYHNDGTPIKYTVVEITKLEHYKEPSYTNIGSVLFVTNTIDYTTFSKDVKITKKWVDPANTEHSDITIDLYQSGNQNVFRTVTLKNGETEYTFTNLPKYDSEGNEYIYTAVEQNVEGYTTSYSDDKLTIINTINQENTVKVEGTKTWVDPQGTEHPTITINLLKNGTIEDVKTLENGTTTYSFENLPKYKTNDDGSYILDENGNVQLNVYTVTENAVEGYTSAQNGTNFTNTINQEKISVSGTKTWIDPQGTEHQTITINLLRNGVEIDSRELANGTTTYSFDNLDKYAPDGSIYNYTVEEENVEGYTTTQNGTNFINTINQKKISVSGTKTWIAPQGAEHPTITINLLRDSVKVDFRELTNGTTTYLFDNLDKYNLTDGHEYVYTVSEEIVEGYTSAQNGTDFTNTIEQDNTVEVAGTKTWVDPEGTTLVHPEITIDLLKNGQPTDKKVVLENGTTEYKFENLPKYKVDENGEYVLDNNGNVQLNEYSVRERTVRNYDTFYDGYNITNTFNQDIQGTIEITTTTPSQTSVKTPLDVVFVLDVSESMNDNDNDKKMVNAVNSAITTIMKENPDSRIGVVAYSSKEDSQYSNTENAITLLELGKYTPKTAGKYLTIQENVYYDYYWKEYYDTISTNVNEKNKTTINVYGGTFTQAGIKAGASILTNATTTYTTTVNGKEKTITRTPVMILLSDGDPTYYKTDFKGLTGSRQGSGSDTTENEAYYTIRTADYYKQQITSHYYGTTGTMSKFYTIGLNMSGTLSETILNPTKANLEKCNKEGTEIISHWWGTTTERNVKGKLYDKIKNDGDAGQYSYADKSYPGSMSSEDLQSIFNTIINDNSTSTETRDITLEESNARRVNLEGIDTSKEFKLTIESTTYNFETAQSNGYVKGNDTEGYYVDLTNVKKGTSITISYHK